MWLKNWQEQPTSDKYSDTSEGNKRRCRGNRMGINLRCTVMMWFEAQNATAERKKKIFIDWYESKGTRRRETRKENYFFSSFGLIRERERFMKGKMCQWNGKRNFYRAKSSRQKAHGKDKYLKMWKENGKLFKFARRHKVLINQMESLFDW